MDCDPFPSANGAHHHRWVNLSLNRSVVPKRDLRKPDFHFRSRSSLSESLRQRASERLGREQAPSEHVRVPLTGRSRTHRTCTLFAQRSPKPERGSGRRPQQQPQPRPQPLPTAWGSILLREQAEETWGAARAREPACRRRSQCAAAAARSASRSLKASSSAHPPRPPARLRSDQLFSVVNVMSFDLLTCPDMP
jgi:hypothetical protein